MRMAGWPSSPPVDAASRPMGSCSLERYDPDVGIDGRATEPQFRGNHDPRVGATGRPAALSILSSTTPWPAGNRRIKLDGRYVLNDHETLDDLAAAGLVCAAGSMTGIVGSRQNPLSPTSMLPAYRPTPGSNRTPIVTSCSGVASRCLMGLASHSIRPVESSPAVEAESPGRSGVLSGSVEYATTRCFDERHRDRQQVISGRRIRHHARPQPVRHQTLG